MNKKHLFICILFPLLTACMHSEDNLSNVDTSSLSSLENVRTRALSHRESANALSGIRAKALKDSSMTIGAQSGLSWASERINSRLKQDAKYLDTIFNFNAMMLTHGVMPPVLEEGDNTLNVSDPNTIRVSDRTYKIVTQARFATTAPNWRDYIMLMYSKPELPDRTLLPKSDEEQAIWRDGIRTGWQKGIEQAYSIFQQNMARLKRDYRGMVLYRKLLQERMISAPFVSRTELGITGSGDDMRVNDQVLRIVELPKLQTSGRNWKAVVVKRYE